MVVAYWGAVLYNGKKFLLVSLIVNRHTEWQMTRQAHG